MQANVMSEMRALGRALPAFSAPPRHSPSIPASSAWVVQECSLPPTLEHRTFATCSLRNERLLPGTDSLVGLVGACIFHSRVRALCARVSNRIVRQFLVKFIHSTSVPQRPRLRSVGEIFIQVELSCWAWALCMLVTSGGRNSLVSRGAVSICWDFLIPGVAVQVYGDDLAFITGGFYGTLILLNDIVPHHAVRSIPATNMAATMRARPPRTPSCGHLQSGQR
ncbi:uncharacterized protein C8Q71DRAFT_80716 [Rhodofomes roseus]|uniref:Uncharacterized protein n=1 Tax=Rhodofomes roseus TaxID=34475 RepID=A0ABQ8KF81_9APHY|nr:uncharacterized protein C8Q71DRAFT_80716 [Rhodofomes roseus]KAH9836380.1 hypothetical protein C8Q71DRAFT_80716 [Rhodofomes roseus]